MATAKKDTAKKERNNKERGNKERRERNARLAEAALAGDIDARNQLWVENLAMAYDVVKRTAFRYSDTLRTTPEDLDCIVSEVCLRALPTAMRSYRSDGGSSFMTYYYRGLKFAAANEFNRRVMRESRTIVGIGKDCGVVPPADEGDDMEEMVNREEVAALLGRMHGALANLPDRWRDVLWSVIRGETYREIAGRLKVTKERVRQIREQALQRMAELMGVERER